MQEWAGPYVWCGVSILSAAPTVSVICTNEFVALLYFVTECAEIWHQRRNRQSRQAGTRQ